MRLKAVSVHGFRSIREVSIPDLGLLNVFIGRNNSGKSSVLAAIDAFFTTLTLGIPVALQPPIGRTHDFHRRDEGTTLRITCSFSLSLAERDELVREIVHEFPQVKNAVDGLDPALLLRVSIVFTPHQYAYIEDLALVPPDERTADTSEGRRLLLSVSSALAMELARRERTRRDNTDTSVHLERLVQSLDESDWRLLRSPQREERRTTPPPSYVFRRYVADLAPPQLQVLETMLSDSQSLEDFTREVTKFIDTQKHALEKEHLAPLDSPVGTFAGESHSVPRYAIEILARVARLGVLHLGERRRRVGREEAQQLLSLKVKRGGPEILRGIQESVKSLIGVSIDAFESERQPLAAGGRRADSPAEMDVDDYLVEMNGSGIREALRLVLDYELKSPDVLLVEEPEVHLHPSLEASVMRYLRQASHNTQIFLTTHSTNFLDTADFKNIYLVTKRDETQVEALDLDAAEERIPLELGIRLSSVFMYDRLVFVEGPSDEAILRELAVALGITLADANVGFISMGGARNFTHYAATATLTFLNKRRVDCWFILDRDEARDGEVRELRDRFEGLAAVHVLQRREVENYLLIPRAIALLVRAKCDEGGHRIDAPLERVEEVLYEQARALKEHAIERRAARDLLIPELPKRDAVLTGSTASLEERLANELHHMRERLEARQAEVVNVVAKATAEVDEKWDQRWSDLVPGDLLLDNTFRSFGVRYRKTRDGARLAALLEKGDVAAELAALLSRIGTT